MYVCKKIGNRGWGWLEVSLFNSQEDATLFSWLLHFTPDTYLIILSDKQGGIKFHFLSLWYDSTWDWTPMSRTICEYSTHLTNGSIYMYALLLQLFFEIFT